MARTMTWPPKPISGRIPLVEGVDATVVQVVMAVSDLTGNPFNPPNISAGNHTFKQPDAVESRVLRALERLKPIISVDSIDIEIEPSKDNSEATVTVTFTDRESRSKRSVTING